MKRGMEKFIKKVVNKVHLLFGENSGKMLLLTGIIGMALSSLAQTLTVVNNKHYTLSQKMFMVPQELIDGAVSIFSLVLITTPLQNLAKKYVKFHNDSVDWECIVMLLDQELKEHGYGLKSSNISELKRI